MTLTSLFLSFLISNMLMITADTSELCCGHLTQSLVPMSRLMLLNTHTEGVKSVINYIMGFF